MEANL